MKFSILIFLYLPFLPVHALSIGYFNLENLFDTKHDENHLDWTFTPYSHIKKITGCLSIKYVWYRNKCLKTNWNQKELDKKITGLKKALQDTYPDILAVSEIENESVLKMLAKELHYPKFVLGKTKDPRGIKNAILYKDKISLKRFKNHYPIGEYFNFFSTRFILQADLEYKNKTYSIFVNHWPSQYKSTYSRLSMTKYLSTLIEKKDLTIAIGDFNTIAKENYIFKNLPLREVLHQSEGTYYLKSKRKWEKLDRAFVSTNVKVDRLNVLGIRKKGKIIRSQSFLASDHLPIILYLQ